MQRHHPGAVSTPDYEEQNPQPLRPAEEDSDMSRVKRFVRMIALLAVMWSGYFGSATFATGQRTVEVLFVVHTSASVAGERLNIDADIVEWFANQPARKAGS